MDKNAAKIDNRNIKTSSEYPVKFPSVPTQYLVLSLKNK